MLVFEPVTLKREYLIRWKKNASGLAAEQVRHLVEFNRQLTQPERTLQLPISDGLLGKMFVIVQ